MVISKERKYFILGILFLCLQILVVVRNVLSGYLSFFWYCDFTPIIFSILFFARKDQMIKGLLNIGLFAQLGYAIILIYKMMTGVALLGFVFDFTGPFYMVSSLIIHLSTLVVFLTNYRVEPKKISLFYSLVFLSVIYFVVLMFTSPNNAISGDYNFIYYSGLLSPHIKYYTSMWILLGFTVVTLPTYFFQVLIYRIFKRNKLGRN